MGRSPAVLAAALAAAWLAVAAGGASERRAAHASGCRILPPGDAFNQRVDGGRANVTGNSGAVISRINSAGGDFLHPDFGSPRDYGIPYVSVRASQRRVPVRVRRGSGYPGQSDRGRQPIPPKAPIEGRGQGDSHVLVLQRDGRDANQDCRLIELYRARYEGGPKKRWSADQVSVFDLGRKLPQRPAGWTSADAAGLPILPGLVRYGEVRRGEVKHAIRITFSETRRAYLSPATHFASDLCAANLPPMGLRLRLRRGYPLAGMSRAARVIATALKRYGAIVADNGSNWFISGQTDRRWNDGALNDLKDIPGQDFQVLDTGAKLTDGC